VTTISPKHALTTQEREFCKKYVAFGKRNAPEAYRRSFLTDEEGNVTRVAPKEVSRRVKVLLKHDYITAYIDEIDRPPSDHAREVLAEQVLFGEDATARRAAEQILQQEDKLGFRDATEKWAEILCAIGAEVVVPLEDGSEVTAPLKAMFPKYKDALPPEDALRKTIQSLDQYLWVEQQRKKHSDSGESPDPRSWEFLKGYRGED